MSAPDPAVAAVASLLWRWLGYAQPVDGGYALAAEAVAIVRRIDSGETA